MYYLSNALGITIICVKIQFWWFYSRFLASQLLCQSSNDNSRKFHGRHFIGFSTGGLPLYTMESESSAFSSEERGFGVCKHAMSCLKQVMADRASFRILVFLCLNLVSRLPHFYVILAFRLTIISLFFIYAFIILISSWTSNIIQKDANIGSISNQLLVSQHSVNQPRCKAKPNAAIILQMVWTRSKPIPKAVVSLKREFISYPQTSIS